MSKPIIELLIASLPLRGRGLFTAMISVIAAACAALHPGASGGNVVGHLGIAGENVSINGARAKVGQRLLENDLLSTGAQSSAIVEFYNGAGRLQLAPDSRVRLAKERTRRGVCQIVTELSGQAFVKAVASCGVQLNAAGRQVLVTRHSLVSAEGSDIQVRVVSGEARVEGVEARRARAGEQATLGASAASQPATISAASDVRSQLAWRDRYRFKGWCCHSRDVILIDEYYCRATDFSFDQAAQTMECKFRDVPISMFGHGGVHIR